MAGLKKALGLFSLTLFGIGMIIGAGIYSVIGAAAGMAGEALWLSFVGGALAALFTGLSYAELSTAMPTAGAEFVYLRRAIPAWRWLSFTTGFLIITAGGATAATVALAFGGYLGMFSSIHPLLAALLLLAACTLMNISGIRQSTVVNAVLTLVEMGGLLIVIRAGIAHPGFHQALSAPLHPGILSAAALIFFVYIGFEDIANLAEEAIRPARDLPRAIIISLVVTTLLYVLVALSVVNLSSPGALAASPFPLATALGGPGTAGAATLGWIALVATANTALISLIVTSRMVFSMARSGELPAMFARLRPNAATPLPAAVAVFILAAACLPLGGLELVAGLSSFAALLSFLLVNLSLIILRTREPQLARPFRVSPSIGSVPLPPLLGILTVLALLSQFEARVYGLGALMLAVGVTVHLLGGRREEKDPQETAR